MQRSIVPGPERRGSVSWNLGSLTAVHGSSLSEACHVFLGFHGGFMCRRGWLSHWPLATESTSDPVPSLEIGGGTESFRPPTTWLAPAGNQPTLFGGVQKSPYYITKDLPNQHLGNSKVFRTCEPEMGRGGKHIFLTNHNITATVCVPVMFPQRGLTA